MNKVYEGSCFCGAVKFTVSGDAVAMGYCHCDSCRSWSAAPVNAFTLWPPSSVMVTQGKEKLRGFKKTPGSHRQWCEVCGGHVFNDHPGLKLTDVYAAAIPSYPYKAGVHVNYANTKLRMRDGLPKLRDFPKELGGSGEAVAE